MNVTEFFANKNKIAPVKLQNFYKEFYDKLYLQNKIKPLLSIAKDKYVAQGNKILQPKEAERFMDKISDMEQKLELDAWEWITDKKEECDIWNEKEYYRENINTAPIYTKLLSYIDAIHSYVVDWVSVKQVKELILDKSVSFYIDPNCINFFDKKYLSSKYLSDYDYTLMSTNWIYDVQNAMDEHINNMAIDLYLESSLHTNPKEWIKAQRAAYKVFNKIGGC